MTSGDGLSQSFASSMGDEERRMSEDDEDDDDETWDEMQLECESFLTCLFCTRNFKTMAVALEHCRTDHNFDLIALKNKFRMDCYSYICMINYVRKENVSPELLLSLMEPAWLNDKFLAPVIQDDPWLMFDFEGLDSSPNSRSLTPDQNYHVVNSENGLVTLSEQHFVQLQHKIKHLTLQVQEKDEALSVAADQIQKMKTVTQNLLSTNSSENEIEKSVADIKISQDEKYFNSYSHFGIHHEMLTDKVRTTSYKDAIIKNASVISNKIVLDVGCGTGILSMFAALAGAAKVFAVDQSDIIFHATDIVNENNLSGKIELIHRRIEDVSLPVEKVDVIISEWMGYFLLYEGMLDSIIKARNQYLKTDGYLLPNKCVLYIIGISDPGMYQVMVDFWSDVYGFKMSCLVKEVIKEAQIFHVPDYVVATTSAPVLNLDLYTADVSSSNFTTDFELESQIDGNLTALCGYFDTFFDLPNPVVLSTSPKTQKTHWKQTVFFLKNHIAVTKGSVIKGQITCQRLVEDNRGLVVEISICDQKNEYYLS